MLFSVAGWKLPEKAQTQNTTLKEVDTSVLLDPPKSKKKTNKEKKEISKAKIRASKEKAAREAGEREAGESAAPSAPTMTTPKTAAPNTAAPTAPSSASTPADSEATPKQSRKQKKAEKRQAEQLKSATPSKRALDTSNPPQDGPGSKKQKVDQPAMPTAAPAPAPAKTGAPKSAAAAPTPAAQPKLTPLQMKMRAKLSSARFRHLNESLYTKPSEESLAMVKSDPALFTEYHEGFSQQVSAWPENPVDGYVSDIVRRAAIPTFGSKLGRSKAALNETPLMRDRRSGVCHIVDLGAGTAPLARALDKNLKRNKIRLDSFDLHSTSPHVQIADISSLPLPDGVVDVAIFCLALMGTNWLDFIDEAYRVLHWKGELWIAEVKSRFIRPDPAAKQALAKKKEKAKKAKAKQQKKDDEETDDEMGEDGSKESAAKQQYIVDEIDGDGKVTDQTDVSAFVDALNQRGFVLNGKASIEAGNKMFVKMWFVKGAQPTAGKNVDSNAPIDPNTGAETSAEVKKRKGKFIDAEEIGTAGTSILKPCVYKVR